MNTKKNTCCFYNKLGKRCNDIVELGFSFCFWHCADIDKTGLQLTERLEQRAQTGEIMEGFQLKGANLDNLSLSAKSGFVFRLINANLSRTSLRKAHLYKTDLSESNLLKADMSGANLHSTVLHSCNLLGVNLTSARLERADWGESLLQETLGCQMKREKKIEEAKVFFQESEEITRNIRRQYEQQGLSQSSDFFYKEMLFKHQQYPRYSMNRCLSTVINITAGYGEKPMRVVISSFAIIMIFSILYLLSGIKVNSVVFVYTSDLSFEQFLMMWFNTIYYSVVTFTTLGYGDFIPIGLSKVYAALEAFFGSFSIALFVVVFVKKMTRY